MWGRSCGGSISDNGPACITALHQSGRGRYLFSLIAVALFLLKRIKGFQRTIEFRVERWHGLFKFIFRNNGLRRRLRRRHLLRTRQSSRTCDPKKSECQRSEEHTSELQSLMRISYSVFRLKKNTNNFPRK